MKTKLLSFALALVFTLGMLTSAVLAAPDAYWAAQKEYNTAMEKGDDLGIAAAAKKIQERYANEHNETAYSRKTTPTYQAALAYERLGMFDLAAEEYAKVIEYSEWLVKNAATEETRAANAENLKAYKRHIRYFNIGPEVYALTSNKDTIPYYGELNEPEIGTYVGLCGTYNDGLQSGYLLYVQYGNDGFSDYEHYLPKTDDVYYLTAAWNSENEDDQDLRDVVNGKTDDYMISELKYLEGLAKDKPNVRILLRILAEQNVWKPLNACGSDRVKIEEFAELYISAYKHIAEAARKYAPSVALVFSPVDYGQWYTTPDDFYPGDEYVDWVGMSTYYNRSSQETNKVGDKGDKNLARGLYNLPIIRTAEIMELAEKHSKPVLISECGFSYRSSDGLQNEAYAAEKMRNFYTYINVVYPQVKLVNYFNANITNCYRLYEDTPYSFDTVVNAKMRGLYEELITANGSMNSILKDRSKGESFVKLGEFADKRNSISIISYFDYPTSENERVTYYLNGVNIKKVDKLPFELEISADRLGDENILEAVFEAENTKITKTYSLYKGADGVIRGAVIESKSADASEEQTSEIETVTQTEIQTETETETQPEVRTEIVTDDERETEAETDAESADESEASSEETQTDAFAEESGEAEESVETEAITDTFADTTAKTDESASTEDTADTVEETDRSENRENQINVGNIIIYTPIALAGLWIIVFIIKRFH